MKTVIIGAGLAGLSAAAGLKKDFIILEKESRPGGLCRSENINGFIFDYTGHFLHLRSRQAEKFVLKGLKLPVKKISRIARIYSNGVYTKYPYQSNNYGLPPEIIEENITGFLTAKFGNTESPSNFKDWVRSAFGKGIAKNFMFPYNSKLWKYPLDKLTLEWMGRFVPDPSVEEVLDGILPDSGRRAGYNASFYYPVKGGIEELVKELAKKAGNRIVFNAGVIRIDTRSKTVYYKGGSIKYSRIISTAPLKKTAELTGDAAMKKKAAGLRAVSVYALNIGFRARKRQGMHWVYVPEKEYPFYRIGFPSEVSAHCAPRGYGSVFAEVSFTKSPPKDIDSKIIKALVKMGIINSPGDIKVKHRMVLKDAYVIYDRYREKNIPYLMKKLGKAGIVTAGRWGNWEYSSMEDAILEGFEAAGRINKKK